MSLDKYRKHNSKPDYLLAILVFVLALFGLLMIYSASVVVSYQQFGYNYFYLNKQAISLGVGIVAWFIAYKLDIKFWQKNAFWFFIISLILLVLVFVPGIGSKSGGSWRWIYIFGQSIQPSEIAKITFITYMAAWLTKKGEGVRDFQSGFIPFAIVLAILAALIMKEPDMGTTIVMTCIAAVMFFSAGASRLHIGLGAASVVSLAWLLIKSSPYRMQRFLVFLNPEGKSLESGYHITQSLLAIGSGGLWGLGFGESKQKYLYLPVTHIDSIFAIIVEELGYLRSSLVVLSFVLLAYLGYRIARNAPDSFSKLTAIGITTWIVSQAFLNIATMIGIVPLTGVPLPFISYGGSSLIVLFIAVGILMNISKQRN